MSSPTWLTIEDVAAELGVSRKTIERLLRQVPGDLPGAPVSVVPGKNKELRWHAPELPAWLTAVDRYRRPPQARPLPPELPKEKPTPKPRPVRVEDLPEVGSLLERVRRQARR